MKKDKKTSGLKNGIKEFFAELILPFAVVIVGLVVALLLPYEKIKGIPAEVFFILGGVILFILLGAIALTVYIIKEIKNKN